MRALKAFPLALVVLVLASSGVLAAGTVPAKAKAAAAQEVAVYDVPKLMEGVTLKSLAQALAKKPGIVAAQVDKETTTFNVTFDPKQTNPDQILTAIATVSKDAKLVKVMPASATATSKDNCGKCPHAKSCAGAKK